MQHIEDMLQRVRRVDEVSLTQLGFETQTVRRLVVDEVVAAADAFALRVRQVARDRAPLPLTVPGQAVVPAWPTMVVMPVGAVVPTAAMSAPAPGAPAIGSVNTAEGRAHLAAERLASGVASRREADAKRRQDCDARDPDIARKKALEYQKRKAAKAAKAAPASSEPPVASPSVDSPAPK